MEIPGTGHSPPLCLKRLFLTQSKITDHAIKRSFNEISYLSFPVYDHPKHTCHDSSHTDHCLVSLQKILDSISIFQCQRSGKVDSHEIILFCSKISSITQSIVLREILCLPDPSENLLLRLGIDPDSFAHLPLHTGHLIHQTINIFSLPSGVGADIDDINIRSF